MQYDALVFSSGGARGAALLGAADVVARRPEYGGVRAFAGASVGSIIAAGLALGLTPGRMQRATQRYPLQAVLSPESFGLNSGRELRAWIRRVLRLRSPVRLGDLPKELVVVACNVTSRRAQYWASSTHPEMDLLDALVASCSVPLMFAGVTLDEALYVDGGVVDPFPTAHVAAMGYRVLGVRSEGGAGTPGSVAAFVTALVDCVAHAAAAAAACDDMVIRSTVDPLDFGDAAVQRAEFARGRRQAHAYFKKRD